MASLEEIIVIDNETREMAIKNAFAGVESDESVRVLHFKMGRYYQGTDLLDLDFRVNYCNANGEYDMYFVNDAAASDDDTITFTWSIGRRALAYMGTLRFAVCLVKVTDGHVISTEFNSRVGELEVVEGLEAKQGLYEANPDIMEQILTRLNEATDRVVNEIRNDEVTRRTVIQLAEENVSRAIQSDTFLNKTVREVTERNVNEVVEQIRTDISNNSEGLKTLAADLESDRNDLKTTNDTIEEVRKEIQDARDEITETSTGLVDDFADMTDRLTTANEQISGLSDALKAVQDESTASKSQIAGHFAGVANVKEFGAVGDGKKDDTAAIKKAIDSLKTTGGEIEFPPGKYLITSALWVYSNQKVHGNNATILQGTAMNSLMRNFNTGTNYNGVGGYDACKNVEISGITFDGGTYQEANTFLGFEHSQYVTIRDCTFKNGYGSWHDIEINSSRNVLIENCIFAETRRNSANACRIQIDSFNNTQTWPWEEGIVDNTVSYMVDVRGCHFVGYNNVMPAIGNHSEAKINLIKIYDNIFEHFKSDRGAIMFKGAYNVEICDNLFMDCKIGVGSTSSYVHDNRFFECPTAMVTGVEKSCRNLIGGVGAPQLRYFAKGDFVSGKIVAASPYTTADATRVSFIKTTMTLIPGMRYRLIGAQGVRYGVQIITAPQRVTDKEQLAGSEKIDSGWQYTGYEFVAPSGAAYAWLTASYTSGNMNVDGATPVYLETLG